MSPKPDEISRKKALHNASKNRNDLYLPGIYHKSPKTNYAYFCAFVFEQSLVVMSQVMSGVLL